MTPNEVLLPDSCSAGSPDNIDRSSYRDGIGSPVQHGTITRQSSIDTSKPPSASRIVGPRYSRSQKVNVDVG